MLVQYMAHFLLDCMNSFIAKSRPSILRYSKKSAQQIATSEPGTLSSCSRLSISSHKRELLGKNGFCSAKQA